MKKITYCLVSFLIAACAGQPTRETASQHPMKIIDAHAHFHAVQTKQPNQPSKDMLKEFEEAGVVGAVVHLGSKERKGLQVNRTGPKLAVCAAATPDGPKISEIERDIKAGFYQCIKVYLGYIAKYPADSFYTPYYKLAEKTQIPVVFHTGDTYDKMAKVKFADPLGVDEVAVTYPKVNFVIAHMGNPWFHSAAEVVYKDDNVYVDLSALLLEDVSKIDSESVDLLIVQPIRWVFKYVENPKKFLFGSDWPLTRIKPYIEAVKKAIPEKHWDDVFYWNAATLFNLDKKPN